MDVPWIWQNSVLIDTSYYIVSMVLAQEVEMQDCLSYSDVCTL